MSRMTYQEWTEKNPHQITDITGDALEMSLFNKYQYRYLGFEDEKKFGNIWKRNLNVFVPLYEQKLRIEPGVSKFDWLVTNYGERENIVEGTNSNTQKRGADTTTRTPDLYSYDNDVIKTDYNNLTDDRSRTGQDTAVHSGGYTESDVEGLHNVTRKETPAGNTTTGSKDTEGIENTRKSEIGEVTDKADTLYGKGNTTGTAYGARSETDKTDYGKGEHKQDTIGERKDSTETNYGKTDETKHSGPVSSWSGNQAITAQLPMSKSYDGDSIIEPSDADDESKAYYQKAYQHMPALDWSTATSQSQDGHREYTVDSSSVKDTAGGSDTSTVTNGKQSNTSDVTNSGSDTMTKSAQAYKDTVTSTDSGSDTTTTTHSAHTDTVTDTNGPVHESTSNTVTYAEGTSTEERQGDKENPDTKEVIYNNDSQTTTYGSGDRNVRTGGYSVSAPHTHGTDKTEQTFGNVENNGKNSQTSHEIYTGRSTGPAQLLTEASDYIARSSAFNWLCEQIDYCFAPWYNEEGGLI